MKKMILLCAAAMMSAATFAQSAATLAKQQAELNAIHMKLLNAKPSKSAKKQAKKLTKEGWTVPAGAKSIEQQITETQFYREELMTNNDGVAVKRYIVEEGISQSGTYNTGYATARTNAMLKVAGDIKTQLVSNINLNLANGQQSAQTVASLEKFKQSADGFVEETLTNTITALAIYRIMPNGNYDVQVQIAFDKKEIQSRMRRVLERELEKEADSAFSIAEKVLEKEL